MISPAMVFAESLAAPERCLKKYTSVDTYNPYPNSRIRLGSCNQGPACACVIFLDAAGDVSRTSTHANNESVLQGSAHWIGDGAASCAAGRVVLYAAFFFNPIFAPTFRPKFFLRAPQAIRPKLELIFGDNCR